MYKEDGKAGVPNAVVSVFFDAAQSFYHSDFVESLGID
jgi:hypothetical protein